MEELEQETQVVVEEQPAQVEQDQRRSSRIRHLPERHGYLITDQGDVLLMDQDEHVTYQEAITGPEYEKWLEAMKYEMDSIERYLKGFIYKRRNSLETLGVSHRIDHIDNRITVYTINDKPVMTFWIEEEP